MVILGDMRVWPEGNPPPTWNGKGAEEESTHARHPSQSPEPIARAGWE